jgi:hypothetical protein
MKKGVDRITQPLYKGSSTRGDAPPNKETNMTNFTAFEVYCTEDKFWAVNEFFCDHVECDERFADVKEQYADHDVEVYNVKYKSDRNRHSVKFAVRSDHAYSMMFANFMVDCWNK